MEISEASQSQRLPDELGKKCSRTRRGVPQLSMWGGERGADAGSMGTPEGGKRS